MSQITKKAIVESTLRIAETKMIKKITVRDIANDCGITRNTFYYYFKDVYDVLDSVLQEEIEKIGNPENKEEHEKAMFNLIEFVIDHKKVLLNLYKSVGSVRMLSYTTSKIHKMFLDYIAFEAEGYNVDKKDLDIIAVFYEEAIIGIFSRWLRNEMPEGLKSVIDRIRVIFKGQIQEAIKNSVENNVQN